MNHSDLFAHKHNHIHGIENLWNQPNRHLRKYSGVPYGIRTRVFAVRGRCPRPLDRRGQ